MIFRYIRIKTPDGELIRLPLIPVRLTCNKQHLDLYALIDSGAEVSAFNASIAKTLNIEIKQGSFLTLSGFVGGDTDSYLRQVHMSIQGLPEIDILAAFTEVDAPSMPILGQRGFFDNYQIRFHRYRDQIEIYPKSTNI